MYAKKVIKHLGRYYGTYRFDTVEQANKFMADNPGWGLIKTHNPFTRRTEIPKEIAEFLPITKINEVLSLPNLTFCYVAHMEDLGAFCESVAKSKLEKYDVKFDVPEVTD